MKKKIIKVSSRSWKDKGLAPVEFEVDMPETAAEAVEHWGEEFVLDMLKAQLSRRWQNEARRFMTIKDDGSHLSPEEVAERMKDWDPTMSSERGRATKSVEPRPQDDHRAPITAEGHEQLEAELRKLQTEERPALVKAIDAAREHGVLSENAARKRLDDVEGRIRELEDKLSRAKVIDVSKLSGDRVKFGATVTLADEDTDEEKTWRIVGADESDPERGQLSVAAPLARAMINKSVGDSFTFDAPGGARSYEILAVEFR